MLIMLDPACILRARLKKRNLSDDDDFPGPQFTVKILIITVHPSSRRICRRHVITRAQTTTALVTN